MGRISLFSQRGAALIVSLVILLVMTVLSVSIVKMSTFEEKMAGNLRDRQLAFEAAEAALRSAEDFVANSVTVLGAFDDDGSDGLYDDSIDGVDDLWKVVDWSGSSGGPYQAISFDDFDGDVAAKPSYIIELMSLENTSNTDETNLDGTVGNNFGGGTGRYFKITVRGVGGSDGAVVFLQTTYNKIL